MKNILFASLLFVFLFANNSTAQQGWEAGGWLGMTHYFGDLNTSYALSDPGLAAGVVARYNFNNRICLKMSGNFGVISADDANSPNAFESERNLSFRSQVLDGTAQLEFNFLPYTHGSKDEWYTPYLLAGFSVYNFNPTTKYNDEWVELRPLGTEGQFKGEEYSSTAGALAFGGGLKLDFSYEWSLNIEISGRKLYTDYIDDVSGLYPDLDDLENLRGQVAVDLADRSLNNIGETGRQRGNAKDNDTYIYIGAGIVYYFGDIQCPPFNR